MINPSNQSSQINTLPSGFVSNKNRNQPWLGAAWKVGSFACGALLNGLARYLSGGGDGSTLPVAALPVYEIVFFQDLFALLILLPLYFKSFDFKQFQHLPVHFFRGLTSAVAVITWYFALFYLPLADAVAISVIGPIMGVVLARWFLKEKLNFWRIVLIGSSMIVAAFMMQTVDVLKGNSANFVGLLFVFISALCFALAKVSTRYLAETGCNARFLTLSLLLFIVPVSVVPAILHWVPLELYHLPWLILAGGLTVVAIMCVSKALIYSEISFLAPFDICRFVLNAAVGYYAFTELPTLSAMILATIFLVFISWKVRANN